jgi:hemerythrin superfamily protein
MATAKKAARKTTTPARTAQPRDAIAMLKADHKKVSDLFDDFEKTRSPGKKKALVAQICQELTVHAQIEEEIFYPAVKAALRDKELVPEATVEHASVKSLIAQVEGVEPDGEDYDAKVKVMSEYVKHHVKEEQNEMFKRAQKTRLDMVALRDQMAARKEELLAMGAPGMAAG